MLWPMTATATRTLRDTIALAAESRLSPSLTSLDELLTKTVGMARPSAANKQQALDLELRSRELTLMAEAPRLQQVFSKLLANAVRFTPPGGSIRVVLMHHAQTAVVVVTDDGAGIPATLLPVIFDRFRQDSSGVKTGGLGLGLATAREVIHLHAGTIHAQSAGENRGSTFTVTLPLHGALRLVTRTPPPEEHDDGD